MSIGLKAKHRRLDRPSGCGLCAKLRQQGSILSLPMFAEIAAKQQDRVVQVIRGF